MTIWIKFLNNLICCKIYYFGFTNRVLQLLLTKKQIEILTLEFARKNFQKSKKIQIC